MTTFLQNKGMDLAIATVTAPLTIYGLHRLSPTPHAGFLAVACTLNQYAMIAIRDWVNDRAKKIAETLIPKPAIVDKRDANHALATTTVTQRINSVFYLTLVTLLPIFWRFMGQRMGIQVPDYILTMGYICLASNAYSVINNSITAFRTYGNYTQTTK